MLLTTNCNNMIRIFCLVKWREEIFYLAVMANYLQISSIDFPYGYFYLFYIKISSQSLSRIIQNSIGSDFKTVCKKRSVIGRHSVFCQEDSNGK